MHDIDRTQLEAEQSEAELGAFGEFEDSGHELPLHEKQELESASRPIEVSVEPRAAALSRSWRSSGGQGAPATAARRAAQRRSQLRRGTCLGSVPNPRR
jgi:hypothetical protein